MVWFAATLPLKSANEAEGANAARHRFTPWKKTVTMLHDFFLPYNKLLVDLIKDDRFKHWLT